MSARHIMLFDTTLRDGAQSSGVDFSVADKRVLANALDQFGIDYIEGGWPGANPSDSKFFANPPKLTRAQLVAFGMTCRAQRSAGNDPSLTQVLSAKSPLACLVGKSSVFQVDEVLKIARDENLRMIKDSCAEAVRRKGAGGCFFDAEHFFDGYKQDSSYALACLDAAVAGGASWLVLCDTNGGTLPFEIERITGEVSARFSGGQEKEKEKVRLGIHAHNDTGNAIANSLAAVRAGADQVQGTLNGIGERCGNADLIAVIPNLMLKMGLRTSIEEQSLTRLVDLSRLLDHRLNRIPRAESPYVGLSAFAHKGGLHGSAVARETRAYEHIAPERVGNRRKIVVSDQAGRANLKMRLGDLGLGEFSDGQLDRLLEEVKQRESEGYSYEDSEASLSLLALRARGGVVDFYTIDRFRVMDERRWNALGEEVIESEAIVSLRAKDNRGSKEKGGDGKGGNGVERLTAAVSVCGPVNALDKALRKGLTELYPQLEGLRLVDYHVRIIPPDEGSSGTEATTRVSIDFMDGSGESWTTVGVSANIIVASLRALDDSYRYMLFRTQNRE